MARSYPNAHTETGNPVQLDVFCPGAPGWVSPEEPGAAVC